MGTCRNHVFLRGFQTSGTQKSALCPDGLQMGSQGLQGVHFEPPGLKEPRKNTMFLHAPMQKPS